MGHAARRNRTLQALGQTLQMSAELQTINADHVRLGADFSHVVTTLGRQAREALSLSDTAMVMAGAMLDHVEAGTPVPPDDCRALRAGLAEMQTAIANARVALERQARASRLGLDL